MSTETWILEAIERSYAKGATIREIQRFIDDNHYEELAIDTIKKTLEYLETKQRIKQDAERWILNKQSNKEDAFKKLFGD